MYSISVVIAGSAEEFENIFTISLRNFVKDANVSSKISRELMRTLSSLADGAEFTKLRRPLLRRSPIRFELMQV